MNGSQLMVRVAIADTYRGDVDLQEMMRSVMFLLDIARGWTSHEGMTRRETSATTSVPQTRYGRSMIRVREPRSTSPATLEPWLRVGRISWESV